MKDYFPLLRGYKLKALLAPFLKLGEVVLELSVPFVVASMIDEGIPSGNTVFLGKRFLLLILFGLAGLAFACTAQYFSAKVASVFSARVKSKLFSHIELLDYETFSAHEGEWMTLLTSDSNNVQTGLNLFLRLLLRSPFVVCGAIIAAFTIDVKLACVFAVVVPILAVLAFLILYFGIRFYKKTQTSLHTVTEGAREARTGAKVFRALGAASDEETSFDRQNVSYAKAQTRSALFSAVLDPFSFTVINVAVVIVLWIGGGRVQAGDLTQGQTVALYNYSALILTELIKFASLIITVSRALASAKRIQKVWHLPLPSSPNRSFSPVGKTVLHIDHLSFRYRDARGNALNEIDFTVEEGQKIGVIGGSGSGKSTLLDVISGLYRPTEGKLFFYGNDISTLSADDLHGQIGYAVQKAKILSGSIRENISFGKDVPIDDAVQKGQASDVLIKKGGADFLLLQGGENLSGGQKQRIALSRAFVGDKPLLLLDDSSSALDTATAEKLYDTVYQKNGQTLLFCSQRISAVRKADKILVLQEGKMQGFDTHDRLLATCPTYREIYEAQYEEE